MAVFYNMLDVLNKDYDVDTRPLTDSHRNPPYRGVPTPLLFASQLSSLLSILTH